MARTTPVTDCEHYGIKDEGRGPYERHDDYCFLYGHWCPRCSENCCGYTPETFDDEPEPAN